MPIRYTTATNPSNRTLLYRFVGADEHQRWEQMRKQSVPEDEAKHDHFIARLDTYLATNLMERIQKDNFAESIQAATFAENGGKGAGGWLCTTNDPAKLVRSTDKKVQDIVKNAEYLLMFSVPKNGCIAAPSDLSKSEGEILVSNSPDLVYVYMNSEPNPFNREQASASE